MPLSPDDDASSPNDDDLSCRNASSLAASPTVHASAACHRRAQSEGLGVDLLARLSPFLRPKQLQEYQAAFAAPPPSGDSPSPSPGHGRSHAAASPKPQQAPARTQQPSQQPPAKPGSANSAKDLPAQPQSSSFNGPAKAAPAAGSQRDLNPAGSASSSSSSSSSRSLQAPASTAAAAPPAAASSSSSSSSASLSAPPPPAEADADSSFPEGVCQFCGRFGLSASEEALDLHYWQECPMLTPCPACAQIIEIASSPEHLLAECEHRGGYAACAVCADAVPAEGMREHMQSPACRPLPDPDAASRCPLCRLDIPPGREGWMRHLLDRPGCAANPRSRKAAAMSAGGSRGSSVQRRS